MLYSMKGISLSLLVTLSPHLHPHLIHMLSHLFCTYMNLFQTHLNILFRLKHALSIAITPIHTTTHIYTIIVSQQSDTTAIVLPPQCPTPSIDPQPANNLRRSTRAKRPPIYLQDFHCMPTTSILFSKISIISLPFLFTIISQP